MLEFRVLGPVDVRVAGQPLDLGTAKQRIVLAALVVDAGRPVTPETLIDRAWGEAPPTSARGTLHAHVSRIRRLLAQANGGAVPIVRRAHGYVLDANPETVDYHRFRRLVDNAGRPDASDEDATKALQDALALWRGAALAGLPGDWAAAFRQTLHHQHLDVTVRWARAQLRSGRAEAVLQPLRELLTEDPTAEPVASVLMVGLHRAGRTAEALSCFETMRRRLREHLGTDPGRELASVHEAVLRGERPLSPGGGARHVKAPAVMSHPRPAMLPPAVRHFTGRTREVATLDAMVAGGSEDGMSSVAVPVLAIVGPAGVGKTALAVEWAHRAADRYPDGALFLDLRGFSASPPVQPVEALTTLLVAMGDAPSALPTDVEQAVARYRSSMAGRRMLVVLDNARDAAQVRPLLPADPACVVVVTSRHRVTGLVAHAAAQRLALEPMPSASALDLLGRILPPSWVSSDRDAAVTLAAACGYLPLALCVAAANIAERPDQPFSEQVAHLLSMPRLSALQIEDDDVPGPRAAFDASYTTLDDVQQRTFRRLGLLPGPDADVATVAALTRSAPAVVETCLERLVALHLVQRTGAGRFSLHDLLREYAGERVRAEDADQYIDLTTHLMDFYLGRAECAGRLVYPHAAMLDIDPPPEVDDPFQSHPAAADWLDRELPNLLAAVPMADRAGHRAAWLLPHALRGHFWKTRNSVDWLTPLQIAVRSADATGGPQAGAASRIGLGHAHFARGHNEAARQHYEDAVHLAKRAGWRRGEAAALGNLGNALGELGRLVAALDIFRELLELYRAEADRIGEGLALGSLGAVHLYSGNHDEAVDHLSRGRAVQAEVGAKPCELIALLHLVEAELERGRLDVAEELAHDCLALARRLERTDIEVSALTHLSAADAQRGRTDSALDRAQRARELLGPAADPSIEALVLVGLGSARLMAGDGRGALRDHDRAVEVYGGSGYVGVQALLARATTHRALGEESAARADATRAVTRAEAMGYGGLGRRAREFLGVDPTLGSR